jgi:hypothetical protein
MDRLEDHADTLRMEDLLNRIGNLGGWFSMNLQAFGMDIDDTGEFANADDAAARDIGHPGPADHIRRVEGG